MSGIRKPRISKSPAVEPEVPTVDVATLLEDPSVLRAAEVRLAAIAKQVESSVEDAEEAKSAVREKFYAWAGKKFGLSARADLNKLGKAVVAFKKAKSEKVAKPAKAEQVEEKGPKPFRLTWKAAHSTERCGDMKSFTSLVKSGTPVIAFLWAGGIKAGHGEAIVACRVGGPNGESGFWAKSPFVALSEDPDTGFKDLFEAGTQAGYLAEFILGLGLEPFLGLEACRYNPYAVGAWKAMANRLERQPGEIGLMVKEAREEGEPPVLEEPAAPAPTKRRTKKTA